MNTFITITLLAIAIIATIVVKTKKRSNNKKTAVDNYNNFHLGEMTSYDIKAKFQKKEKDYAKKYSQRFKNSETLKGNKK